MKLNDSVGIIIVIFGLINMNAKRNNSCCIQPRRAVSISFVYLSTLGVYTYVHLNRKLQIFKVWSTVYDICISTSVYSSTIR